MDPWTDEEKERFYVAVDIHGHEVDVKTRFTKIAEYVGTKKPKQCALFARARYMQQGGQESAPTGADQEAPAPANAKAKPAKSK